MTKMAGLICLLRSTRMMQNSRNLGADDRANRRVTSVSRKARGDERMERLFAVTRSRGVGWNNSRPIEGQEDWQSHAAFMNALQTEGFVLLGGPLEGTPDVLLIVRANGAEQIRSRLSGDSWTRKDLLRITQVVPWTLRLGSLG